MKLSEIQVSDYPPLTEPTERHWFTYPEEFTVEYASGRNAHDELLTSTKEFADFVAAERFRQRKSGRMYRQMNIRPDAAFPRGIAYISDEVLIRDFD